MNHRKFILPVAILWSAVATIAFADTFTVINADDTGTGSLRQAITDANNHAGLDTIAFNIPDSGVHTITPASPLPTITDAVIIDGYTQPGAVQNSSATGFNGTLLIELEGSSAGGASGLRISAGNSTVRGLVINRFVLPTGGDDTLGNGILLEGAGDDHIEGNFIGTKPDGVSPLGNARIGVTFTHGAHDNLVGGTAAGANNRIAFNTGNGVDVDTAAGIGNAILSNSIFGNGGLGIDLAGDGVTLNDLGDPDTGPNNLQNFPVLTSVSSGGGSTAIAGTLNSAANTTYRIEFFANNAVDSSGYGEGQSFAGSTNVTTDANGNASFNVSVPQITAGRRVTSTATDPNGNTSEFSGAIGQLLNISSRLRVQTGENVLIAGFIVTGTDPKKIIARGIGPSLTAFGVPGALADPTLELHDSTSTLAMNDNWRSDQQAEIEATGLAPTNDLEAAIVRTLPANNTSYTAIVRGKGNTTGVGVVEAYDLDTAANSKLGNISARGLVETGDDILIGGFIAGNGVTKVIVRAIGPTLAGVGITNPLPDPTLELHNNSGATIAMNDDWRTTQEAEIIATGIPPADNRESAIVASLTPGNYTAVVRGKNITIGIAVVEVYNIP